MRAGYCDWSDLMAWRYSWAQIWEMIDMCDLHEYIDWEAHALAESIAKATPGRVA